MDLAEDGDEALVVDLLLHGGERLAAAELFEHVVNAGKREAGMLLLLTLVVGIESLAECADALLEGGLEERSSTTVHGLVFSQPLAYRNRQKRTHQGRAALEFHLRHKLVSVLLRHVAECRVDEGIRQVGDTGEIERHRLHAIPDAFNAQVPELVAKVTIGEEFAEFGDDLEFEFHEGFCLLASKNMRLLEA